MSRYSEAQFDLIDVVIEDVSENRNFSEAQMERLRRLVYKSDRLWTDDIWGPLLDFVEDVADEIED